MEIDRADFDKFCDWLKLDGLRPRKSERLWKKTILSNLLNNQKMTLDNFHDFLEDKKKQEMIKKDINIYDDFNYSLVKDKTITTSTGSHKIRNIIEADSQIHLFFKDGGDLLVSKIDIQKQFGK